MAVSWQTLACDLHLLGVLITAVFPTRLLQMWGSNLTQLGDMSTFGKKNKNLYWFLHDKNQKTMED